MKYRVAFDLEKEKGNPNIARLRMRVRWEQKKCAFSVGYRVDVDKWSADIARCRRNTYHGENKVSSSVINSVLDEMENLVAQILSEGMSVDDFRTKFNIALGRKEDINNESVYPQLERYKEYAVKVKGWTEATIHIFNRCYRVLSNFAPNLKFSDINKQFIDNLILNESTRRAYLDDARKKKATLRNSSILRLLGTFRTFVIWANKQGLCNINTDIFENSLKLSERQVVFLEWDELMAVFNYEPPKNQFENQRKRVRDMFCLGAFTSLRWSDICNLRWSDIHDDAIYLYTKKTADALKIELNDYSRAILERQERKGEKVFVSVMNKNAVRIIRLICRHLGFDTPVHDFYFCGSRRFDNIVPKYEMIGTHSARRTFICNALMMGIPPTTVMKWTGHSSFKTMQRYINVSDSSKKLEMEKFNRK